MDSNKNQAHFQKAKYRVCSSDCKNVDMFMWKTVDEHADKPMAQIRECLDSLNVNQTLPPHLRLSSTKLFNSISTELIIKIDQLALESRFQYSTMGSIIQEPGTEKEGLSFVIEGKLRLYKTNSAGKQYTVGILSPGCMFGEIDSFSLGTHGNYIEVIEDTFVCSVYKEPFEQLLDKSPELTKLILNYLSMRLKERDEFLEKIALKDLRGKVLFLLSKLSIKFGIDENGYQKIDLPLTHQELANMIGASREAVSHILQEFSNEGIIVTGRRLIMVNTKKISERKS